MINFGSTAEISTWFIKFIVTLEKNCFIGSILVPGTNWKSKCDVIKRVAEWQHVMMSYLIS